MTAPPDGAPASDAAPDGSYRLVSATFGGKEYSDGILVVFEAGSVVEIRQWIGKKKRELSPVARFRIEPGAEVTVDGPAVRASGLLATLDSPAAAREAAEILRHPANERGSTTQIAAAESAVLEFLAAREEAITFLRRVTINPREALFSAQSKWVDETKDPFDAELAAYSEKVAGSLEKLTSFLADTESKLGPVATERLYAFACTMGAVQDALLGGDTGLVSELSALQQLGISTTAQALRAEGVTESLMLRAHPFLVGAANAPSPAS